MKHLPRLIGITLLALVLALAPAFPLWSQTPEPVVSPPPTQVAASGTYETVACSTLATPPAEGAITLDRSP
jgi:hypothetical protein